jgi:glycosyltransferase involved in cell wall biosynthesis
MASSRMTIACRLGLSMVIALSSSRILPDDKLSASALPPVLIVGDHLGYEEGVVHGVTIYLLNVLPALRRAGLNFTACFLRRAHPAAELLVAAGITPIFMSAARLNPLVVLRVAALVRKHKCRVIHASGIKGTLVARIAGRMSGARVIVHLHDLNYPGAPIRILHWLFSRASDIGLCLSNAAREVATRGYHVPLERQRVIYNGVQISRFRDTAVDARSRIRAEFGILEKRPVIGMIGRFYPVKGHRNMVGIMARIVNAIPGALLIFVGDGPERTACERQSVALGLIRNILFAGQREDVPELLAAMDLVVVPSTSEGLGLAAIEALAAGRPVVAYDVGGLREVVTDGVDGYVVNAGDQDAFAKAVIALLGDLHQLRSFGEHAQQSANRFGLDEHIQKLLKCYRDIAAQD